MSHSTLLRSAWESVGVRCLLGGRQERKATMNEDLTQAVSILCPKAWRNGHEEESSRALRISEDLLEERYSSQHTLQRGSAPPSASILGDQRVAHPTLPPQKSFLLLLAHNEAGPIERRGIFCIPPVDLFSPRGRENVRKVLPGKEVGLVHGDQSPCISGVSKMGKLNASRDDSGCLSFGQYMESQRSPPHRL